MTDGHLKFDKPIVERSKWNQQIDFQLQGDVDYILDKALRDSGEASPVSYANFAVRIPEHEHQKLADAQQQLLDYRSWATLNWWDAVFTRTSLPQGTDKESTLARVSRVAEMGEKQILTGPWFVLRSVPRLLKVYKFLILSSMLTYFINSFDLHSQKFETKRITAEKSKIHESIIQEVLKSFVRVPKSAIPDLERIFNIIITAIEAKSQVSDNLAHLNVSNTLEYGMGNIRSGK